SSALSALHGPHLLPQLDHVVAAEAPEFDARAHAHLNSEAWTQKNESSHQRLAVFNADHGPVLASFTPNTFDSDEVSEHLVHAERVAGKFFGEFRMRSAKKFLTTHALNPQAVFDQHSALTALRAITQAQAA